MKRTKDQSKVIVDRVGPDCLDDIAELQRVYPYKSFQRRAQGLNREKLLGFYAKGLSRGLETGTPTWVARGDGATGEEIIGGAQLSPDAWHSDVFGLAMGKIGLWLNTQEVRRAGRELLTAVEEEARAKGMEHLAIRIDGEDFPNLSFLEDSGFRLVDLSLKLSRNIHEDGIEPAAENNDALGEGWRIRPANPEDKDWIRNLAAVHHTRNHFFNDPALAREKAHELFGLWCERCLDGLAYRIYVIEEVMGERNVGKGFVIYLRNRSFADALGKSPLILDFVILDPSARGKGLGPYLIQQSMAQCARDAENRFDYCELRTSQDNLPAISMYERLGFRVCAGDFILHRSL